MLGSLVALVLAPPVAPVLALFPVASIALLQRPPPSDLPPDSLIARTASVAKLSPEWLELRTSTTASIAVVRPVVTSTAGPVVPAPPPATEGKLRIVYTGGAGGIGSGRYDFGIARRLTRRIVKDGGRLVDATPYHGAMAHGVHVMLAEDRRIASLVRLFDQGWIRCADPTPARSIRTTKTRMLVDGTKVPASIEALPGQMAITPYEKWRCTAAGGATAFLYGPAGNPLPTETLTLGEMELRLGLHLVFTDSSSVGVDLDVVGVPADDPARRYRALRSLVEGSDVLYADAGSFVDGASTVVDGELSLHRPLGFRMLEGLRPSALAPGETELVGGAVNFVKEVREHRLPYVATNWVTEDETLALPPVVWARIATELGPARVAFLGAIDPAISTQVPRLAEEGVTLSDPLQALEAEVLRLQTSTAPPDLIVVLTSARWQIYEQIQSELRGIDLVMGETSPIENRMASAEIALSPTNSRDRLSANIMPLFEVGVTELSLVRASNGRMMVKKITIEPHRLIESLEPDAEVMARVTQVRARTYPALDRPLVRPPGDLADPLSRGLWSRLVCESVKLRTGADVVLLPELPPLVDVLGPQTELMAVNGLSGFDRLEVHQISGRKLIDVLRDAPDVTPVACGGQIGVRAPQIRGRTIEDGRVYRVVSTDRARLGGLGNVLAGGYGVRLLDARHFTPLLDDEGHRLSLRSAVLGTLREARDEAGTETAPVEALLKPSETTKSSLYLLRANRASLSVSSFKRADQRLPDVKESRANASSSLAVGIDVDLQMVLDLTSVTSEVRALARYAQTTVFDEPEVETEQADDARFSTALTVPALRTGVGPVGFLPYGEVSFDTEVTPINDTANRQAALFFTSGLAFDGVPTVTLMRVGASVGRDYSLDLPYAFSLRTEVESNITFGYDLALKLRAAGDWFAPTDGDTTANLRFGYTLEGRLALPLARWLNLSAFAQTFLFRGALVTDVELSHTLGLALDVSGAFAF